MRPFLLCCLISSILLAFPGRSNAQVQDAYVTDSVRVQMDRQLMMFRVDMIHMQDGDRYAFLNRPDGHGLFVGSAGVARSVYKNAGRETSTEELGRAQVVFIQDSLIAVLLTLSDTTDANNLLYENDVVELAEDIPFREERTVFFDFVKNAIQFLDSYSEPLFTREEVLRFDGPALRDSIEANMVFSVHETADMIREMIDENPQWDIDIEEGRFSGMKMVDAMAQSDQDDVHAFLLFVTSYPGKYLGQDWKINETYATWLINAAPPGEEELRDMMVDVWETPEYDALLNQYAEELADGIFTTGWNNHAEALGDEGRYQEAMLISDIVARVAAHLNDENMRGYMLFSRADIAGSMEDYDASIAMYEEAVSIFRSTDDIRGESIAINNLGMALNNQERYQEAIDTYSRAIELKLTSTACWVQISSADCSSRGQMTIASTVTLDWLPQSKMALSRSW